MRFLEDQVGRSHPFEWFTIPVVGRDEVADALHALFDAGERHAAVALSAIRPKKRRVGADRELNHWEFFWQV